MSEIEWTKEELEWLNQNCIGIYHDKTSYHVYSGAFSYDVKKDADGFSCVVYDENETIEGNGQSDDLPEAIMNAMQDYLNNSDYIDTARILIEGDRDSLKYKPFIPQDKAGEA